MSERRPFTPPPLARPAPGGPASAFASLERRPPQPAATGTYRPPPPHREEPPVDWPGKLQEARDEAEQARAETEAVRASVQQLEARYAAAIGQIEEARTRARQVLARDAVTLAVDIATALVTRAFEVDRAGLLALVDGCLAEFSEDHPVLIRTHPDAVPDVEGYLAARDTTNLRISPDPNLQPGDFCAESEQLVIDGRVGERLEVLQARLASCVGADELLEVPSEPQEGE